MSLATLLRLRDGTRMSRAGDGTTRLAGRSGGGSFGPLTANQRATLDALATGDRTEADLLATDVAGALALLHTLRTGGWLVGTLTTHDRPLLTVEPAVAASMPATDGSVVLSRFALLRRDGAGLLLESPRTRHVVRLLAAEAAAIVTALATPARVVDLPGRDPEATAAVVGVLVACGLVTPADGAEESRLALAQWAPHELLFHARSRQGRHELPYGGTYWARGRFDPLAARPAPPAGRPGIALPAPPDAPAGGPGLAEVMAARRSIRTHDDTAPLTVAQLGEFLHRTAHTSRIWVQDGVELADRPYPSGGALHELELYPVVTTVDGLDTGLYHYDGRAHRLDLVTADGPVVRRLARRAAAAARMTNPPQVLLVITARFGRVMWKYQSMGYALTLKNTGALMSAMYLVATAMGLAPCALGGGDADQFGRAAGLEYESESSVGEFLLGTPPAADRT